MYGVLNVGETLNSQETLLSQAIAQRAVSDRSLPKYVRLADDLRRKMKAGELLLNKRTNRELPWQRDCIFRK